MVIGFSAVPIGYESYFTMSTLSPTPGSDLYTASMIQTFAINRALVSGLEIIVKVKISQLSD